MIEMEKKQLLEVIKSGENQEVELKESLQDFAKLMAGFANTNGGMIIIGVNAGKKIIGLKGDLDSLQEKISALAQTVSPALYPDVKIHNIDGKKLVSIVVQKAVDNTAHSYQGVFYARVGSTIRKLEGDQAIDFLRGKQILCFDEDLSDAVSEDLDVEKIREYFKIRNQENFLKNSSVENFLLSSKLATGNGSLKIKNAAALFFAKEPEKFFPQIEIKLAQYDGTEPVNSISNKLIQSDPVTSIEQSIAFVKKNISKSIQITDKPRRQEKFEYPPEVIREAIVNAVAHRDYFSMDSIQVYLFNDRIEITSPGSLPKGLPKELFGTLSIRRNPIIYRLLRDYGYIEGLGSGVPRMINVMRKNGLRDPYFGIDYERIVRIVLYNEKGKEKPIEEYADLNKRQKKAIEFLKKHRSIKTKKYAELNNVSSGTAISDINELLKFGYIKKVGSYRGAYYVLNEEK